MISLAITDNFNCVSDETNVNIDNFDKSKCAIIVYDDGCLCDDDSAVDFDTKGELSNDTYNIIEGVFSYEGILSMREIEDILTSMGYKLYY